MIPNEVIFQVRLRAEMCLSKKPLSGPIPHVLLKAFKQQWLGVQCDLVQKQFQPAVMVQFREISNAENTNVSNELALASYVTVCPHFVPR